MQYLARRCFATAALLFAALAPAGAQTFPGGVRPTPEQAQQLLRDRPDLIAQLRQRIATSGLTADQVRARLRAEGYPENLLDAYLTETPDPSARTQDPNRVFAAVRALGIVDSVDVVMMRRDFAIGAEGGDSIVVDSLSGDTTRVARLRRPGRRGREGADTLQLFGHDLFERGGTLFEPNLAGPVDGNYRLGPGDQLVLILTGDVEAAYTLDVTREGFVVVPTVGQMAVANLTMDQLESLLQSRLSRVYSGVGRGAGASTRFSVSVSRLRSNQVFVVGDARQPGSYRISSAGTAMTALYAAGGPADNGSLRRIEIRRGGRLVDTLDVYDYLLRGDASRDVRLQTGDVVFVPVSAGRVTVTGEVQRPAIYEVKPGELVGDVIRAAGGFTPTAVVRRVQIERVLPPAQRTESGRDRIVIDVTSEAFTRGGGPQVGVEAGDIVRVFRVADRVRNRVTVRGNVWAPGPVGFTPGMTVGDAIRLAGGPRPDVYLGRVLVSRLSPDSTRQLLRVALRDTVGNVLGDLSLEEDDEIQVFSTTSFRPERFVAISGAVRKPGRYPFQLGMTMRDLVLLAGGVQESAYLQEAEIARLPEDRSEGRTARTFRAPLDSSYLFERRPDGTYHGPPGLPVPSRTLPDVELQAYDNVLILRQPDWDLGRTVVVAGEVRFPGRYAIRSKGERLTDVVRRAGGLTPEAYPEGVVFYRNELRLGRVGVDLPRALRDPRHRDNLILVDRDSIFVPPFNAVVNVTGAVNSPVAVAFVPGKDLDFYIRAAGGGSRRADIGRAYVTQANGKVESRQRRALLPDGVPAPRPGSVVFIPERDPSEKRDYVAAVGSVAQVLASLVAIVVVIARN